MALAGLVAELALPGHLGALHPVEQALTILVAFAPFLLLGVIALRRRVRHSADAEPAQADLDDLPWQRDLKPPS